MTRQTLLLNYSSGRREKLSGGYAEKYVTLHYPLGLGMIAAMLRERGHDFDVFDACVHGTGQELEQTISSGRYGLVLISAILGNYAYAGIKDVAARIRAACPKAVIVVGGPMATTIPERLLSQSEVDFAVFGEGEETILELLDALAEGRDPGDVPGVCSRGALGLVRKAPARKRIANIDRLPLPLYEAFPMEAYADYLRRTGRCWELIASRGCYGQCTYCCRTYGRKVTRHSVDYVVEHMCRVRRDYGIDRFNFVDDNFLSSQEEAARFAAALRTLPERFNWRFQGRIDDLDLEQVSEMASVGLFDISLGLESGSQAVLDFYKKRVNAEAAAVKLRALLERIDVHASFIIGAPVESRQTLEDTEAFLRRTGLRHFCVGILTLFPGTVLYEQAVQDGVIADEERYLMELGPVYVRPYTNLSPLTDAELIAARTRLESLADGGQAE